MSTPRTIVEKIWDAHVVAEPARRAGAPVRRPAPGPRGDLAAGLRRAARARAESPPSGPDPGDGRPQRADHGPRAAHRRPRSRRARSSSWKRTAPSSASPATVRASDRQGVVHVIGPELGLTQPGMTVVCGDSHTATHGAFGALAFGIGTSEVETVLATQCLLQRQAQDLPGHGRWQRSAAASRPRTSSWPLIARIGSAAAPAACSSTAARPSARSRWKSA